MAKNIFTSNKVGWAFTIFSFSLLTITAGFFLVQLKNFQEAHAVAISPTNSLRPQKKKLPKKVETLGKPADQKIIAGMIFDEITRDDSFETNPKKVYWFMKDPVGVSLRDPVRLVWYPDKDGDGYGHGNLPVENPNDQEIDQKLFVLKDGDCDDKNPERSPGSKEICDYIDNDCNGKVDDVSEGTKTWYMDFDGDGFGNPEWSVVLKCPPENFVGNNTDCHDNNKDINPKADEIIGNDQDENCDDIVF